MHISLYIYVYIIHILPEGKYLVGSPKGTCARFRLVGQAGATGYLLGSLDRMYFEAETLKQRTKLAKGLKRPDSSPEGDRLEAPNAGLPPRLLAWTALGS